MYVHVGCKKSIPGCECLYWSTAFSVPCAPCIRSLRASTPISSLGMTLMNLLPWKMATTWRRHAHGGFTAVHFIHTRTHARTYTHTHACTHVHTHTHMHILSRSPPYRFAHEPHVALFAQILSGEVEEGVFNHWLETQTAITEVFSQQQEDKVDNSTPLALQHVYECLAVHQVIM